MELLNDDLKNRLSRYRQIKISVIGRNSGRTISIPVWFVLEADGLYLLPVLGSETPWYKNVLQNPSLRIDARGMQAEFRAAPITNGKSVKSVVEKFRDKYGANVHHSTAQVAQTRSPRPLTRTAIPLPGRGRTTAPARREKVLGLGLGVSPVNAPRDLCLPLPA